MQFGDQPLIHAPPDPSQWPEWRTSLGQWRKTAREHLRYSDRLYRKPEFAWINSIYSCCFLMIWDQAFYDAANNAFRVDRFIEEGLTEFGGYDAVVLWHAYPNIGFDDRNQYDFYRRMPGGIEGLRALAAQFHRRGMKVFIDYNPWDTGTRREGRPDAEVLAELVAALEADGIFLDTLDHGDPEFRTRMDVCRPGAVLESECSLPVENVGDHHMSWAQDYVDGHAPGVLRNKWFERRHMMHVISRWPHDHSGELHSAWMNGVGMLVWENVFGSWNGWCARDKSILRAMLPIQRRYCSCFSGEGWTPLVETAAADVFASLWEGPGIRLWTLVNRSRQAASAALSNIQSQRGENWYDLIHGCEVDVIGRTTIPSRGIGCLLAAKPEFLGADFPSFLKTQAAIHAQRRADTEFMRRKIVLTPVIKTETGAVAHVPTGMVSFKPASRPIRVSYRTRECGLYESVEEPKVGFHRPAEIDCGCVQLPAYAIDRLPVTNAQFHEFLKASGYRPTHAQSFLKHWTDGKPPGGTEKDPVTYVDLDDARAYSRWRGVRLPTEQEWQHACESEKLEFGSTRVWNWTESERSDGRTRFCILKGGSWFEAVGSVWYADGGPKPCSFAAKYILMWPGQDRLSTVGFRCVVDVVSASVGASQKRRYIQRARRPM